MYKIILGSQIDIMFSYFVWYFQMSNLMLCVTNTDIKPVSKI